MRKFLVFSLLIFSFFIVVGGSAFQTINVIRPDYVTVKSHQGIIVQSTSINADKSITVVLKNSNICDDSEIATYTFEWYLSFKGKRISDYFNAAVRCNKSETKTVYFWPDTVKAGQEKYITVQLGREPKKRDPRDDD